MAPQTKSKLTIPSKPNQTVFNQTQSKEIYQSKLNQFKPKQTKSNQSVMAPPNQIKIDNPFQTKPFLTKPNQKKFTKATLTNQNRKKKQIKPSQVVYLPRLLHPGFLQIDKISKVLLEW